MNTIRGGGVLALAIGLAGCVGTSEEPSTQATAVAPRVSSQQAAAGRGDYTPAAPLLANCQAVAAAFDAGAAGFCGQLFGPLNARPPLERADCIKQGSQLDAARATAICNVIYPALGYSSDSPVTGPTGYVTMPDGTQIAINLRYPDNYQAGQRYPVMIEMSGYESGSDDGSTVAGDLAAILGDPIGPNVPLQGGTRAAHGKYYQKDYISITASVRGTGCSSGQFDLFSRVSARDGYNLVEWAAAQPWSNGKVGLFGHSYSGITASLIAAEQPPHLVMASISGLIGDLYRDIVYPGGITNYGFPLLWTGGVRLAYDLAGGTLAGLLADNGDRRCLMNQTQRSRTVLDDPILHGLEDYDNDWYQDRSVVYRADRISVPTQILIGYQDEQTGPRGANNIFDHLRPDLPRRLVMLNGDHDSQAQIVETIAERKAWIDYWMLGKANPFVDVRKTPESVRVLLEVSTKHPDGGPERSNGEIDSTAFPLPETVWTDYFLQPGGGLSTARPTAAEAHTTYFHGSRRQAYSHIAGVNQGGELTGASGPDEAAFRTAPFAADTVIAGPLTADLFVKALPAELPNPVAPVPTDLELEVQVIDEGPDGALSYLQRGLLRAADRAIDASRSQYTNAGRIYRPYRPHRGPVHDLFPANSIQELLVEIFPLGHVFRAGHRLVVKIHAPGFDDNDYIYVPKAPPTIASLYHDAAHPSSLMLPVIPAAKVARLGPDLGPCASARVRCVYPAGSGTNGTTGGGTPPTTVSASGSASGSTSGTAGGSLAVQVGGPLGTALGTPGTTAPAAPAAPASLPMPGAAHPDTSLTPFH